MVAHWVTVLSIRLENVFTEGDYASDAPDPNFGLARPDGQDGNDAEQAQTKKDLRTYFPKKRNQVFHQAHSPLSYFPSMNRLAAAPRATRMAVEAAAIIALRFTILSLPSLVVGQCLTRCAD